MQGSHPPLIPISAPSFSIQHSAFIQHSPRILNLRAPSTLDPLKAFSTFILTLVPAQPFIFSSRCDSAASLALAWLILTVYIYIPSFTLGYSLLNTSSIVCCLLSIVCLSIHCLPCLLCSAMLCLHAITSSI
ncbi:hypothetical protein BDV18DRAFT_50586 [Aspergillus unguis]